MYFLQSDRCDGQPQFRNTMVLLGVLFAIWLFCGNPSLAGEASSIERVALFSQLGIFGSIGACVRMLTLLLILYLLPIRSLSAAIYYVRKTGNNSNAGTSPSTAWLTFAKATSTAAAGDYVYFGAGTYAEAVKPTVSGTSGSPIRFVADTDGSMTGDAGPVKIVINADAIALDKDNYLVFEGFCITGTGNESFYAKDSTGVEIRKCELTGSKNGAKTEGAASVLMVNCLIDNNQDRGIEIKNTSTVNIWNCTFTNHGKSGIKVKDSAACTVTNTIIANSGEQGLLYENGTLSHSYNLLYNNTPNYQGITQDGTEILADPKFVDSTNGDYRLKGTSPAINAGTSASAITNADFDGYYRPVGPGFDMGCYEYLLIANWKFETGSGSTAYDYSGNNFNGTLQGSPQWAAARCGQTVKLNGSTDWVNLASTTFTTSNYTVGGWFKTSSKKQQTLFAATATGTPNHLILIQLDSSGHVQFIHRAPAASSGGTTVTSTDTYADYEWHYVTAIKSSTQMTLYVDGELVGSANNSTGVTSEADFALGRQGASLSVDYFKGSLDEWILYASALSANDISEILGLVGRWKLNETSGTVAYDSSPLGKHGIYVNGVILGGTGPTNQLLAAQFDGVDDYVSLPAYSSDFSTGYTISVWANPTASNNSARFLGMGNGQDTNNFYLSRNSTTDTLETSIFYGSLGGQQSLLKAGAIVNNAWHHYAATVSSAGAARLYVDGEEVASGTIGVPANSTRSSNFIAKSNWATHGYFQGMMHEVQLYNRELCADEIDNLYQGGLTKGVRVIKWLEVK